MKITKDTVVLLEYEALLEGKMYQHTHVPKAVLVGRERNLPPGLEDALLGCAAGERFTLLVPDAFGWRDPGKVVTVPKEQLPVEHAAPGDTFSAQDPDGAALEARVIAVDEYTVTVDLNHPHAGKTLELRVHIHDVRVADASELEHGHAHGAGGVEHQH
jgi:FKBP-type peptidyl-prolyl cis-trans isomerase SlyD